MQSASVNVKVFPLPARTPALPWEGMASLLSRTAAEMGYRKVQWLLSPQDLPYSIQIQRIELLQEIRDYEQLGSLLRLDEQAIYQLTMHRFAPKLQNVRIEGNGKPGEIQRLLLGMGSLIAYVISSLRTRVCPHCLKENPAYGRLYWGLKPMVLCPRHHILLIDRCPKCSRPITPLRNSLTHCSFCPHGDYRIARVEAVPDDPFFQLGQALIFDRLGIEEPNLGSLVKEQLAMSPLLGLSPWQYFLLYESLKPLLIPLFPDAPFLRANREMHGALRHLAQRSRNFSLKEDAVYMATFHAIFDNWPENFFTLLDILPRSTHPIKQGWISETFGAFYKRQLYDNLADPAFEFLREAFADYLVSHYSQGHVVPRQRAFRNEQTSKLEGKRYLSQAETKKILKVQASTLDLLVEEGVLSALVRTRGKEGRRVYQLERTSVEKLQRKWEGLLTAEAVAQMLGIAYPTVIELEATGLVPSIQTLKQYPGRIHAYVHLFPQREVEQFTAKLLAKAVKGQVDISEVLPLARATKHLGNHWKLVDTISQVLSGGLVPIDLGVDAPLLWRLVLSKEEVARFLEQSDQQQLENADVVSLPEAAANFGVSASTLKRWKEYGLLDDGRPLQNAKKPSLGVAREALERFKQRYVSSKEASSLLGISDGSLWVLIHKEVLHPVAGPGTEVDTYQVLLNRKEIECLAPSKSISSSQAASLLGVTPFEVACLARTGRLAVVCVSEGLARFLGTDIKAYLQEQKALYQQLEVRLGSETGENEDRPIPVSEIADMLNVPVNRVYYWIRQGRLPASKVPGQGRPRYYCGRSEFLPFIRSLQQGTEAQMRKVTQYLARQENPKGDPGTG